MSLGLLAWASLASPALAAEDQAVNLPDTQTTKAPTVDAGSTLLKTILALALVVGIIWVAYKLMKKFNFRTSSSGHGPAVEVISRTQLDRDMSVYVLRLGSQVSVVSRSGSGSSVLRTVNQEEAEQLGLMSSVNETDQRLKTALLEIKARIKPGAKTASQGSVEELLEDPDLDLMVGDQGLATVDELLEQER